MTYNMTLVGNATYGSYPVIINTWTNNLFGLLLVGAVFLILLLIMRKDHFATAMMTSSIATVFFATILFWMEILPMEYYSVIAGVLLFATILAKLFGGN